MKFDIITIFPDFFQPFIKTGVIGKAVSSGKLAITPVDLRAFTYDRHRTTDDRPFGGGEGMLMTPAPLFEAINSLKQPSPDAIAIYMTPRGKKLTQTIVANLSEQQHIIIICGRYEGIDERICKHCVDMEISIGDYVLSGGELPALVLIDAVSRLVPGVLGCNSSAKHDSFSNGLLEHPQYTRPEIFNGWRVPEVLLSGNHSEIALWRRKRSLLATAERRPDLLNSADISADERQWIKKMGYDS